MLKVLFLVALIGCSFAETVAATVTDHGTVYVCDTGEGCPGYADEYCWDGSEGDLETLLGATCHAIDIGERAWPALVGCTYGCDGDVACNAHCSCFCPPGDP